jgi:excisionase family DNA binding protein
MTTRPDADALLTITEAARAAGVSRPTVRGWITRGFLPTVRIGQRHYVPRDALLAAQQTAHLGMIVPAWRDHPRRAGQRLRTVREAAGMSQRALATATGLTHDVISCLETGKEAAQASTIRALAQALAVDPARFVSHDPLGPTLLSVAEAAAWLEVPIPRLQTWLGQGQLPGTKVCGRWRIPAIAVVELERSGRLRGTSRRLDPRYRG